MGDERLQPGAHLAAALAARGAAVGGDEARELLDRLLRLFELGALVFEDVEGCTLTNRQPPKYTADGEA